MLIVSGYGMQTYSVTKTGRMIQLDGFLMEWKKDSAKTLGSAMQWHWDAVATKEGLAGYITAPAALPCSVWTSTLYTRNLSPYSHMDIHSTAALTSGFYRISRGKESVIAEWVLPWDSIAVDSSGRYIIGCVISTQCGDTLAPIVFTGQKYREQKAGWGAVYSKGIMLTILLAFVLFSQLLLRRTKRKKRRTSVVP